MCSYSISIFFSASYTRSWAQTGEQDKFCPVLILSSYPIIYGDIITCRIKIMSNFLHKPMTENL